MKKQVLALIIIVLVLVSCNTSYKTANENIVTSDVENFWNAYDKITTTQDTVKQMAYLNDLFLSKGTSGLSAIMDARRYTPNEYLKAINSYPKFWNSIRENTLSTKNYTEEIQNGIDNFKNLYPDYKPAKIYFEIGVFRASGTALDSLVLIGAELAMTNEHTKTSELPKSMQYVKNYAKNNPIDDLAFLNIHEFVHTQQNVNWAYDLLSQSVFEGSAEFIAEIVAGKPSIQPAIKYGSENDQKVKTLFSKEMFSPWYYNWIWNDTNNEFNTRDLGYYIGYAIVKKHYDNSDNKQKAIKEIIEIDFEDQQAVENFVENTGYFKNPLNHYKIEYENERPIVTSLKGIDNGSKNVNSNLTNFTVVFSKPMDKRFRSTGLGELGKDHFPKINSITFSDDGLSAKYDIELKPNTEYEMIIETGYRTKNALPLKPYSIKFKTGK